MQHKMRRKLMLWTHAWNVNHGRAKIYQWDLRGDTTLWLEGAAMIKAVKSTVHEPISKQGQSCDGLLFDPDLVMLRNHNKHDLFPNDRRFI